MCTVEAPGVPATRKNVLSVTRLWLYVSGLGFPMIIGALISEGKINQDYINQLREHFLVDQIWKITDEQKAEVFESFVGYNFIQKVG